MLKIFSTLEIYPYGLRVYLRRRFKGAVFFLLRTLAIHLIRFHDYQF